MASTDGPCCGHDHVGGDELWMSVDDMIDLIRATTWETVREILSSGRAGVEAGPGELGGADRARIRRRYDGLRDEREVQAAEVEPGRRHVAEARRERRWGGRLAVDVAEDVEQ